MTRPHHRPARTSALLGAAALALTLFPAASGAQDQGYGYDRPLQSWEDVSTRDLQHALQHAGYDPGAVDGRMGPGTRSAIRDFQRDHGLPVTGRPSRELYAALEQVGATEGYVGEETVDRGPAGDRYDQRSADSGDRWSPAMVADVQYALRDLGYTVSVDGEMDAETRAAIRSFQRNQGLRITGEPSGPLLTELQQAGAYGQDRTARADRTWAERQAGGDWGGQDRYDPYGDAGADRQGYGEIVRRTEMELRDRGYRTGPVDMRVEPETARAIQTVQQQLGLEPSGEPSRELLAELRESDVTAPPPSAADLAAGLIGGLIQQGTREEEHTGEGEQ